MLPIHSGHRAATLALACALALALMFSLLIALSVPADAGGVTLRWTAPGDDGTSGRATAYDLRWSTAPITDSTFASATPAGTLPMPQAAGSAESFRAEGLPDRALVYFALRARDERWNWGPVSNLALARIGADTDVVPGAPLALLGAPVPNPARAMVRFTLGRHPLGALAVDVFDAAGRWVRTLTSGADAGPATLAWDLTDDGGTRVPAGCYLVRAAAGGRAMVRRVLVIR